MKQAGMFTAAQARNLSNEEYVHYMGCGCIEVEPERAFRVLREADDDAKDQIEEFRHELQTLRGAWQRVMKEVREFAQELMGNETAIKLDLKEPPHVRP
jgi:prefoldin subunit 5